MNTGLKVILAAAACIFALSAAALLVVSGARSAAEPVAITAGQRSADPLAPDEFVEELSIPPFELTTQDGGTITSAAFDGHVTIVDFVFTNCPLVCPMMTGTLADLSERLAGTDVRFLSISVDPDRDTPETLREFGAKYGADFSRWTFARGDRESTWKIVREGLMFAIEDDDSLTIPLADGSTMLNIRHPSHFVLVGPTGRVLGLYSATDDAAVKALETRARQAAAAVAGKR